MYSPLVLFALFLGVLLIVTPINGKLFILPPYALAVFTIAVNEVLIKNRRITNCNSLIRVNLSYSQKVLFYVFLVFISNSAINYYTGLTFITAIGNLFSGDVNYAAYQLFFKDESRYEFELVKLLHVTSIALIKLVAFYSIYTIAFHSRERIAAFIFITPMIVYSVSRGTSIEFFELALFFITTLYVKSKINLFANRRRMYIWLLLLSIFGLSVFLGNISLRLGESLSDNVCFGPFCYGGGLGSSLDPLFFFLSGYFLGGFYNISTFISANEVIGVLFPGNMFISRDLTNLCSMEYQCAAWHPLLPKIMSIMGIFILIVLALMHKVVNYMLSKSKNAFMACLIVYHYSYFVFSLFVGEGLFASSSNTLIFSFVIFVLFISPGRLLGRRCASY